MLGLRATLELPSYSDLGSPKKRHHPGSGGGHLGEALATCAVLLLACAVVGMQLVAAHTQLAHLSARTDQLESQLLYEKNEYHRITSMVDSSRTATSGDRQRLEEQLRMRREQARALRSQLLQVEDDIVRVRDQVDVTNKEADKLEATLDEENEELNEREEEWVHDQEEWEDLEGTMKEEIESLDAELKALKDAPLHPHHEWHMPRHMGHAPVLDVHNAAHHHHYSQHAPPPVYHHEQQLQY